jgi:hypothetical protein
VYVRDNTASTSMRVVGGWTLHFSHFNFWRKKNRRRKLSKLREYLDLRNQTYAEGSVVVLCNNDRFSNKAPLNKRYQRNFLPLSSSVELNHVIYSINCRYLQIISDTINRTQTQWLNLFHSRRCWQDPCRTPIHAKEHPYNRRGWIHVRLTWQCTQSLQQ